MINCPGENAATARIIIKKFDLFTFEPIFIVLRPRINVKRKLDVYFSRNLNFIIGLLYNNSRKTENLDVEKEFNYFHTTRI